MSRIQKQLVVFLVVLFLVSLLAIIDKEDEEMALTPINGEILSQPLNDNFSYLDAKIENMAMAINVKDFGAKGDGVTDDTQAIQNAINTGKCIFFPEGTYLVNSTLIINNDAYLLGASFNTNIISAADPIIQTDTDISHFNIANIKITATASNTCLYINKTWSNNAQFTFSIKNVFFYSSSTTSSLLKIYGAREGVILNSIFATSQWGGSSTGISFSGDTLGGAMNIQISNCIFYNLHIGINANGNATYRQYLSGIKISDSIFIAIDIAINATNEDTLSVINNIIDNVTSGIKIDGVDKPFIINNYFGIFSGADNNAISISATNNNVFFAQIKNNYITNYGTTTNIGNGIVINANNNHIMYSQIYNNIFNNLNICIQLTGTGSYYAQNNLINGNTFKQSQTGIQLNTNANLNSVYSNYFETDVATIVSDNGINNSVKNYHYGGKYSSNSGKYIASGDGTTTTFSFPHSLISTPNKILITLGSPITSNYYATADATNIYITFSTAPPAETNNIVFYWSAEI